jgi:hypothetical protein
LLSLLLLSFAFVAMPTKKSTPVPKSAAKMPAFDIVDVVETPPPPAQVPAAAGFPDFTVMEPDAVGADLMDVEPVLDAKPPSTGTPAPSGDAAPAEDSEGMLPVPDFMTVAELVALAASDPSPRSWGFVLLDNNFVMLYCRCSSGNGKMCMCLVPCSVKSHQAILNHRLHILALAKPDVTSPFVLLKGGLPLIRLRPEDDVAVLLKIRASKELLERFVSC